MGPVGGLKITTEVENGKTVLTLRGKVTIGTGGATLGNAIRDLLDQGFSDLVIDLHNVSAIDSCGIGELAAAHMAVTNRGGTLELRRMPRKMRDVLSIADFPDFPDFPGGFAF